MRTTAEALQRRDIQTRWFDSSRWDHVRLRDGDIIVGAWGKSGSTLTLQMVAQLIREAPEGMSGLEGSPWVDLRWGLPIEQLAQTLEAQTRRRLMKTHLPFYGLSYSPKVKYIYIGRDARDVIWSCYNHVFAFTQAHYDDMNALDGPWPKESAPVGDVRSWYLHWLETDEAPGFHGLSFWEHVQSWWDQRKRANILLLHYANVVRDLRSELRRIAAFLDVPIDESRFSTVVEHCGMDYMREHAENSKRLGTIYKRSFKDGAANFFNKGTNGRWRDVLSAEEIARCDEVAEKRLSPDCAHWLKTGEVRNSAAAPPNPDGNNRNDGEIS